MDYGTAIYGAQFSHTLTLLPICYPYGIFLN